MTREEKCKIAIEKGYTYDEITGKIYSRFEREIKSKLDGYIHMAIRYGKSGFHLRGHQFAYYIKYGKIVECIDHIDGNRSNNRIDNLREVTKQQNGFNTKNTKGYYFDRRRNKFQSTIVLNYKQIYLGAYDTELEARQAYLQAKEKYHII